MASPQVSNRQTGFDPFLFPADTSFRFVLLIVAVVGTSLFVFQSLAAGRYMLAQSQACPLSDTGTTSAGPIDDKTTAQLAQWDVRTRCMAPYQLRQALVQLAGLALLFGLATAIYAAIPHLIRRRGRLRPLPSVAGLDTELSELCRASGLAVMPRFVYAALDYRINGLAFGLRRAPIVSISAGLLNQYQHDRPRFRAVVLHELAHIRNADVSKTYYAVAITVAFLLVVVLPYSAYLARSPMSSASTAFFVQVGGRILAVTLLVFVALAAVLRTRELYADARATQLGSGAVLHDMFTSEWCTPRFAIGRLSRELFHPSALRRRQVIAQPERLSRMGFWEPFWTGVIAVVAVENIHQFFAQLGSGLRVSPNPSLLIGLLFGPLAAGVVGSGIWRMSYARLDSAQPAVALVPLATGLTLGSFAGLLMALSSRHVVGEAISLPSRIVFTSVGVLLFMTLWAFLGWARTVVAAWLGATPDRSLPGWVLAACLVAMSGVLGVLIGMIFDLYTFGSALSAGAGEIGWLILLPLFIRIPEVGLPAAALVIASVALWAAPLSAELWAQRRHPSRMDPGLAGRLRLVSASAMAGALLLGALSFALRVLLRLALPPEQRSAEVLAPLLAARHTSYAVGIELLVAMIVAATTKRSHALWGLAALATSCFLSATIVFVGINPLVGCVAAITVYTDTTCRYAIDLAGWWTFGSDSLIRGSLLGIPATMATAVLVARMPLVAHNGVAAGSIFLLAWLLLSGLDQLLFVTNILDFTLTLYWTMFFMLAGAAQFGAAIATVARARQRRLLRGMAAAMIAGSVAAAGIAAFTVVAGLPLPEAPAGTLPLTLLGFPAGALLTLAVIALLSITLRKFGTSRR